MLTQPRLKGLSPPAAVSITLHAGGYKQLILATNHAIVMYSMPETWREQIQRLARPAVEPPLSTTQRHVAWENALWRVECNLVRSRATLEDHLAVRIVPAIQPSYTAVVVAMAPEGGLHVIGRYRYPLGRWSIEFPRFEFESGDDGWKESAQADLFRLTGLSAESMTLLGAVEIDPALLASSTIVILAEGCRYAATARQKTPNDAEKPDDAKTYDSAEEHDELVAGCVVLPLAVLDDLVRTRGNHLRRHAGRAFALSLRPTIKRPLAANLFPR